MILNMDEVILNSFKNFHTKGFDYICLKRTPSITRKLYFFEGDVSTAPEVVAPHNHRYEFATTCVAGAVENIWFRDEWPGMKRPSMLMQKFDYRTPLNGGDGFTHVGEQEIWAEKSAIYGPRQHYLMQAAELHTIRIAKPDTILVLDQYKDVVPLDQPTQTYRLDTAPPNLDDGLYEQFTADEIIARLRTLRRLAPQFTHLEFV
ncbi:hypothetical protein GS982_01870 [Rhodococcus hoagii]|uniref:Uncharacterized protein n=1 Tax=Rhodococcus hoagii TaxID=43767 RepID=A0A9Q4ZIV2_RHOHA|nr:hypothetical protein [Prescottella equi]NKT77345.1 hypothetical protein [Prescottella equi]NKZ81130.1 hypothetical protein [Prescottella equi]